MNTIYMDNNATTKVADEVISEMTPYMGQLYGNPSSMHSFGGQVGKKIFQARDSIASLLGCSGEEIVFTSCGTESDNTAIRGVLAMAGGKRKIFTTRVEHPAVLGTCRELEQHVVHGVVLWAETRALAIRAYYMYKHQVINKAHSRERGGRGWIKEWPAEGSDEYSSAMAAAREDWYGELYEEINDRTQEER